VRVERNVRTAERVADIVDGISQKRRERGVVEVLIARIADEISAQAVEPDAERVETPPVIRRERGLIHTGKMRRKRPLENYFPMMRE
jgi:hypothetical protein